MSSSEYNQLLKFLYFEGYADSYEEAENLLEEMSDEEFEDLLERKYDKDEPLPGSGKTPSQKMQTKRGQHAARVMLGNPALGRSARNDPERDSYRDRASMMDRVKDSLDKGEEPRDNEGRKNLIKAARRPRASYERQDNRPGGLRAGNTKAGGHRTLVRKEETEMQEEQYRTTASGRRVRWDEDEATDNAVSDMLQKRREAAAKKAATARLAAKGNLPIRKPQQNEEFESYVENLQNEGYDLSNWTWDGIEEFYIDEAKKEFPSDIVKKQSAKHMRDFLTRPNSAVGQRSKQKSKKMDAIRSTVEVGDDPRKTIHGQDLRKIGEEFEELDERKLAHSFPLKPSERRSVENIRARLNNQEPETPTRSARKVEPVQPRKKRKLEFEVKENFEEVVEYLFVEGYADTIENAELMAESISAEWVDEILDEKYARAMDTTGRGADRRASDLGGVPKRRKPTPDKYKHSEGDFSPRDLSPGARRRRDERRQGVGGFNEAKADPQDAVQRLRARNMRLQQDHPEVPSGRDQTEYRRKRHQESRGKKKGL
jgi:hypothetical protein